MPTLVFCTGFEQGNPATLTPGGTPAAVVDGPVGSGTYALDINVAAGTATVNPNLTLTASNFMIWGFALQPISGGTYLANLGFINAPGAVFPGLRLNASLQVATSAQPALTSPTLTSGQWYWVDWKLDTTTTTWSASLRVTNLTSGAIVYDATNTAAGTAGTMTRIGQIGTTSSDTVHYRMDDWVASMTGADYPLGPHKVLGFVPNAYDATDTVTAADFAWNDGTTNNQALTTGSPASAISEIPWTSTAGTSSSYVKQTVGSGSAISAFQIGWANAATAGDPDAVTGYCEKYLESGVTASSPTIRVVAGGAGGTSTIVTNASLSVATAVYTTPVLIVAPGGGWTNANLLASLIEFGFASVTTSPPCLAAVMLEASYAYAAGSVPPGTSSVSDPTGSRLPGIH